MSNAIKCPYCNEEIEGDSQFCSKCGKVIKENTQNNITSNSRQFSKNNTKSIGVMIKKQRRR